MTFFQNTLVRCLAFSGMAVPFALTTIHADDYLVPAQEAGQAMQSVDDPSGTSPNSATNNTPVDTQGSQHSWQDFERSNALNRLHHLNQTEINFAKLAQDKGSAPALRTFAARMIQDHQKADLKVINLAKSDFLELQSFQAADYEQSALSLLDQMSGAQFDYAFAALMQAGHREAVHYLETGAATFKDPHLKSLVVQHLSTVRDHELMATALLGNGKQLVHATISTPTKPHD